MRIKTFLNQSPLYSLYAAYDSVIRDFQRQLAKEDVHFIQALILTGLFFEEKAVQPSVLAAALGCSRSNISHAVRDLEKRGWLERQIGQYDARSYHLNLTRLGKRKAPRLIKLFDSTQEQLEAAGAGDLNPGLRTFVEAYQNLDIV